ncbi:MAG: right-handed parallel beta-helix repeat-containing protein, partial [Candidatus Heimdallarchaeota archaeon]|nr:right-handed parallel beta-helix repeat-containing protein [Candidatus Heimdallarchaeota archaeon]MCK4877851.1 right-handed parallel beta-helix repeat-containing protein [Candidatus Heimdallarchaeota archaeon]
MRVKLDANKVVAVIIALGFLSVTVIVPMVMTRDKVKIYEILSDDDFKKYKFVGEGTEENPFIIENLNIVEARKRAIVVKFTSSYFIIRNSFFANNPFNAIYIESIAPGTARIYNNTCVGHSTEGIRIESSDYVEVLNNTFLDNKIGIGLYDSNYCEIDNNQLFKAQRISGKDPAYFVGLVLKNSNFTTITNNFIKNTLSGMELENSNNCTITGNLVTRTYTIGIYLLTSSFCIIKDTVSEASEFSGIILRSSHYNLLESCTISENLNGISLFRSDNNHLSLNLLQENAVGLLISDESFENIINLNEFRNNTGAGVKIESGGFNIVYHNSFYFND